MFTRNQATVVLPLRRFRGTKEPRHRPALVRAMSKGTVSQVPMMLPRCYRQSQTATDATMTQGRGGHISAGSGGGGGRRESGEGRRSSSRRRRGRRRKGEKEAYKQRNNKQTHTHTTKQKTTTIPNRRPWRPWYLLHGLRGSDQGTFSTVGPMLLFKEAGVRPWYLLHGRTTALLTDRQFKEAEEGEGGGRRKRSKRSKRRSKRRRMGRMMRRKRRRTRSSNSRRRMRHFG